MSSRNKPNRSAEMRLRADSVSMAPLMESVASASVKTGASTSATSGSVSSCGVQAAKPSSIEVPIRPETMSAVSFLFI